jgi:MYND finger/Sel1 repeat
MAEKTEDDAATLRESIQRLRVYIHLNPVDKNNGATNASLKHRRTLQLELEETMHRLAEVVETNRVEEVARHAVDSGQAVVAMDIGRYVECPLCLDEMPGWHAYPFLKHANRKSFPCCGKICCGKCIIKFDAARVQARRKAYARGVELPPVVCPFCRTPQNSSLEGVVAMLLRNARAGRAWAQNQLGQDYFHEFLAGDNVADEEQAIYWLSLAAQQGHVVAQFMMGGFWLAGNVAATMRPSVDKALQWFGAAARQGHATAQYYVGKLLWKRSHRRDANALMWMTLSAAQGSPLAQVELGKYFETRAVEDCNVEDMFNCMYWTRKAALIGETEAQAAMELLLPKIKMMLYDGKHSRVGYSCLPEVFFWKKQHTAAAEAANMDGETIGKDSRVRQCACCGKAGTSSSSGSGGRSSGTFRFSLNPDSDVESVEIKILKCAQCRSLGYCSKACQKKHWQMGHRVDCQKVTALKEEMELAAQYPHLRFD